MSNVYIDSVGIDAACPGSRVIVGQQTALTGTINYRLVNQDSQDAFVNIEAKLIDSAGNERTDSRTLQTVPAHGDLTIGHVLVIQTNYDHVGMINATISVVFSGALADSYFAACSFLVKDATGTGVGLPSPPIDSITEFAVNVMYPGIFTQVKSELPNSVSQVQSDAALGASLDIAIAQATANASGVPGPFGFLPDIRDTQSPIQRRTVAKFKEFEPDVLARGTGKFPDAKPAGVASLSGVLSQGMALRLAMQELGEDARKFTFM